MSAMEYLVNYLQSLDPTVAGLVAVILGAFGYIQRANVAIIAKKLIPMRSQDMKDFEALDTLRQRAARNGCPKFADGVSYCLTHFYSEGEK